MIQIGYLISGNLSLVNALSDTDLKQEKKIFNPYFSTFLEQNFLTIVAISLVSLMW